MEKSLTLFLFLYFQTGFAHCAEILPFPHFSSLHNRQHPPTPMKGKQTKTECLRAWASKPPLSAITRRETDTNCTLEAYNGLLLS